MFGIRFKFGPSPTSTPGEKDLEALTNGLAPLKGSELLPLPLATEFTATFSQPAAPVGATAYPTALVSSPSETKYLVVPSALFALRRWGYKIETASVKPTKRRRIINPSLDKTQTKKRAK